MNKNEKRRLHGVLQSLVHLRRTYGLNRFNKPGEFPKEGEEIAGEAYDRAIQDVMLALRQYGFIEGFLPGIQTVKNVLGEGVDIDESTPVIPSHRFVPARTS